MLILEWVTSLFCLSTSYVVAAPIYEICLDFSFLAYFGVKSLLSIVIFFWRLFWFPNFTIHRSLMRGTMPQLTFQHSYFTNQNMRGSEGFKVLQSWMYPQSILPPSLISVLSSSTSDGGCQAVPIYGFFFVLFLSLFSLSTFPHLFMR